MEINGSSDQINIENRSVLIIITVQKGVLKRSKHLFKYQWDFVDIIEDGCEDFKTVLKRFMFLMNLVKSECYKRVRDLKQHPVKFLIYF